MKKSFYTAAAAAILMTLPASFMTSCSGKDKEGTQTEQEVKPVVKVQSVQEKDVDQIATFTATVEPELINNISSSTPNRIKHIYVDEGVRVSKGQKLVLLDDVNTTSYEIQVDNARANLRNVQTNYDRAVELLRIGGGTRQQVDQMEIQLINAKNALSSAERTLRNVRENTVLTSPINGIVTARNYDPGDMTGSLPIVTVAQVNPVKIIVNASESELSRIHKGMPVSITFDTYGDEVFKGTVALVMPTVDAASKTFGVEITLPNPNNRILPGMFARVTMNLGQVRHVVVPDVAVIKQPGSGNHYVYVYKDGKVSYNQVELGQRIGDTYELISGVEDGSQVVVSGMGRLANGMSVELAK